MANHNELSKLSWQIHAPARKRRIASSSSSIHAWSCSFEKSCGCGSSACSWRRLLQGLTCEELPKLRVEMLDSYFTNHTLQFRRRALCLQPDRTGWAHGFVVVSCLCTEVNKPRTGFNPTSHSE